MGTMKYLARGLQLFQVFLSPSRTTKHRKRQLGNLASDQLHHLASKLLTLLQANPWEREYWCEFKSDVASLVQSLVGYTVESLTSGGLKFPCVLLVYSPGSSIGNLHFLWKVPFDCDMTTVYLSRVRL